MLVANQPDSARYHAWRAIGSLEVALLMRRHPRLIQSMSSAIEPRFAVTPIDPADPAGVGAIALAGRWTAAQFARGPVWQALRTKLSALPRLAAKAQDDRQRWDLTGVEALDHVGAQLIWNHWGRRWPERLEALPMQRQMLERVAEFSTPPPVAPTVGLRQHFLNLGAAIVDGFDHAKEMTRLVGQLLLDLLRLAKAPAHGPWRDISGHVFAMGASALPITALVGFLIGVVLAYLSAQQLRAFGADAFIVNMLGLSLIRELGPVLAAILVAGRSGSAITAQIGVMRVNEELDAMRVMGISHGFRLVMPRAIALAIAMPLVSVWTTLAALLGGMLAANAALDVKPIFFITALPGAVDAANLWLATGKSIVFGIFIALIGCHFGLRVEPNTESLGRGTTTSVVAAITMVILIDALFAIVFRGIGL